MDRLGIARRVAWHPARHLAVVYHEAVQLIPLEEPVSHELAVVMVMVKEHDDAMR